MLTTIADFDSLVPALGTMRQDLERAFGKVYSSGGPSRTHDSCPISLWQDDQRVHIEADVPGMSHDQLQLNFEDGNLWIRGERTWKPENGAFEYNERRFVRFERKINMADSVDPASIDAILEDGVLHITFMKRPEAQPRAIPIRSRGADETRSLTDDGCMADSTSNENA